MYIKKSRLIKGAIAIVLITVICTVCALNPFGIRNTFKFLKFSILTRVIGNSFYEEIDMSEAVETALLGVTSATGDPYTFYVWGDDAQRYMEQVSGNYCGIGVQIGIDDAEEFITIEAVLKGGPAEAAGISVGDRIVKVDGQSYSASQINEITSVIKGEEGTEVTLTILSVADKIEHDVTLIRSEITTQEIEAKMIDDKIGYIALQQFTEGSAQQFKDEYTRLTESGAASLIIDLRGNPGGLLPEVIDITSLFVPNGELITYTLDKYENCTEFFSDSETDKKPEIDIVVLIDGNSASASEVFTGAMKDYKLATIIGDKSYGKGIVQSAMTMKESVLSVTVARYYTPNGVCIHGKGIEPDIKVEMSQEKKNNIARLDMKGDEQLVAAIKYLNKK